MALHNGGQHNGSGIASVSQAQDATNSSALLSPKSMADMSVNRLLFQIIGADMNTTNDQLFAKVGEFQYYNITLVRVSRASISMSTAAGGIYTAASKGGNAIIAASQVYSGATTSALAFNLSMAAGVSGPTMSGIPILSLSTPQGATATMNFRIYGHVFNDADA